jgi:tripartite-type tricarboxylate transporter receptor subunit TctC
MHTIEISRRQLLAGAGLSTLVPPRWASAQTAWPTKAIRFVVPFAPGGSSEIVARAAAVEIASCSANRCSSTTSRARWQRRHGRSSPCRRPAHADLGHIGTLAVNPYIFDKLPYDANRDFKPISLLAKVPSLYLVHPDLPVRDLREFVAHAKKNPGKLNYGSAGNGSAGHLAMEYLKMASGTFITHVPYRGTGPQLTDLMAGRLDAASVGAAAVLQFIKTGKLRCIATGTTQRIAQLPDVATVAEQGYRASR